jgi:hypothetical protein
MGWAIHNTAPVEAWIQPNLITSFSVAADPSSLALKPNIDYRRNDS